MKDEILILEARIEKLEQYNTLMGTMVKGLSDCIANHLLNHEKQAELTKESIEAKKQRAYM